jgi:hypothetical protein
LEDLSPTEEENDQAYVDEGLQGIIRDDEGWNDRDKVIEGCLDVDHRRAMVKKSIDL